MRIIILSIAVLSINLLPCYGKQDAGDLKSSESCATIVLALTDNHGIGVNRNDPHLKNCAQAKNIKVCAKASDLMNSSSTNQGKMPSCQGSQVADAGMVRINITMPDGSSNFYMSSGGKVNADANYNYLKARGFNPSFDLGNP